MKAESNEVRPQAVGDNPSEILRSIFPKPTPCAAHHYTDGRRELICFAQVRAAGELTGIDTYVGTIMAVVKIDGQDRQGMFFFEIRGAGNPIEAFARMEAESKTAVPQLQLYIETKRKRAMLMNSAAQGIIDPRKVQ